MNHDPIVLAAQRFYGEHQNEHLARDRQQLIHRCTVHLADVFALSTRTAEVIAMQVRSEIESAGQQAYIDTGSCTQQMLILRDPVSNQSHLVTAGDLAGMVKNRPMGILFDLATGPDLTEAS